MALPRVSIVIPAYNEEKGIEKTVRKVKLKTISLRPEIIVVDDGSKDGTYAVAKKIRGIRLIKQLSNKGKAEALKAGFALSKGGLLATIDADCTYPPESLASMVKKAESGFDMVIGSRFLGKNPKLPFAIGFPLYAASLVLSKILSTDIVKDPSNYYGNAFFSWAITILTGKRITDGSSGLRIFKRSVWEAIGKDIKIKKPPGLEWEVEMTTRAIKKGFSVAEIPIKYYPRAGVSKLRPFADGIRFLSGILRGRF
ncbi:MAG: glycosyltransferase family 2 protein [Candidatus Aenigmatarchaeota archaeon]